MESSVMWNICLFYKEGPLISNIYSIALFPYHLTPSMYFTKITTKHVQGEVCILISGCWHSKNWWHIYDFWKVCHIFELWGWGCAGAIFQRIPLHHAEVWCQYNKPFRLHYFHHFVFDKKESSLRPSNIYNLQKKFPRYIKLTYQLLFKAMFPKIRLEFGRQAINSRQGKSAAKAGTLNNIS